MPKAYIIARKCDIIPQVYHPLPKGTDIIEKSTSFEVLFSGDPYGNRTHVTAVKGPCLNRLTNGPVNLLGQYITKNSICQVFFSKKQKIFIKTGQTVTNLSALC